MAVDALCPRYISGANIRAISPRSSPPPPPPPSSSLSSPIAYRRFSLANVPSLSYFPKETSCSCATSSSRARTFLSSADYSLLSHFDSVARMALYLMLHLNSASGSLPLTPFQRCFLKRLSARSSTKEERGF
jgi:hypothetical protein